jgi:hypothetical protein
VSVASGLRRCVALHKASKGEFPISVICLAYEELHGCCIRRPGSTCEVRKEFLGIALEILAQAIEARRGETSGSVEDESAVPKECAHTTPSSGTQS